LPESNSSIIMIENLLSKLGNLSDSMVFVGGSVVSLYKNNKSSIMIRPTYDVDAVISVKAIFNFYEMDAELKKRGFVNCALKKSPICRYRHGDLIFDLMPDDESILGFSNTWYKEGLKSTILVELPGKLSIKILSLSFFICSKIEAFISRGQEDYLMSHDLEDILILFQGLNSFSSILDGPESTQKYIRSFIRNEIRDNSLVDYIYGEFPSTDSGQTSAESLVKFLRSV
jgi:hypothetical protein